MNPKMTLEDAAQYLGHSQAWVYAEVQDRGLTLSSLDNYLCFEHKTSVSLFQISFKPRVFVFQILKGGTGKTSLALEFAVRASLYGAKVVCIDLDQQGNLTQAFNQNAEESPVMVDVLSEGYGLLDSLLPVASGIDILPSRIENALLDEVLRAKKLPLERVYRDIFKQLKNYYDVIIVDCPPSLGQSVAAAALAADRLIAPVTPEKFAITGLNATCRSLAELEEAYNLVIPCHIILNKFEENSPRSQETLEWLSGHPEFHNKLLNSTIRLSQDFPEAALKMDSIFDQVKATHLKQDVDQFTRRLLEIGQGVHSTPTKQKEYVFV